MPLSGQIDAPVVGAYGAFLRRKEQERDLDGFRPVWMPDFLFDFQSDLTEWSIETGRADIMADCGLGKTPMQLVWAENVHRHTNKPVLIATPLAVGHQTLREAEKFDIEAERSLLGKHSKGIVVTSYDRLHYFDPNDFAGMVLDESSAIKHFSGVRQRAVTEFMRKMRYRLLCSATQAPNDTTEFGTAAEALGQMGHMDMLSMFFKTDENSLHPTSFGTKWKFKAHAEEAFWRWTSSWARAIRKPSDLGYSDGPFVLPELIENEILIENTEALNGSLFVDVARTLNEQRQEQRLTIRQRCEEVARRLDHDRPAVAWCNLNEEGDLLEKMIPGAKQVAGSDTDEHKERVFLEFESGEITKLITKATIAGFGLNWQHCAHATCFPSHSFEQYYQLVRRFWRFGQDKPVSIDLIATEGSAGVLANLRRKSQMADRMFDRLVATMRSATRLSRSDYFSTPIEVPAWLA